MSAVTTPMERYDAVASEYDRGRRAPFWRIYDEVTLRAIARALGHLPARVLDAGAGTGLFSARLAEAGHEVTLLDPSRGMLDVARGKLTPLVASGQAHLVRGRMEDLAFPDESFDFVLSEGDPLSYCVDTHHQAAREILRVLRPGGGFYVSCDNRWFAALTLLAMGRAPAAERCIQEGVSLDPYGLRVRAFTANDLRALFEAAGARDVRVGGKISLAHLLPDKALTELMEDEARAARLVEVEAALSEDATMAGAAFHLHLTGRKHSREEAP